MAGSAGLFLANPLTTASGLPVTAGTLQDCPGGSFVFAAVASAWNGATATLQVLGPDGATLLSAGTATTLTANGMGYVLLPPGQVQVTVTGGTPTNFYASLARVIA